MLDVAGLSLTDEDRKRLAHNQVGGVILFSRNYESPEQN
jgi:beta-N-acetylhexosaminidase